MRGDAAQAGLRPFPVPAPVRPEGRDMFRQKGPQPPRWFPASVLDDPSVRVATAVRQGDEVVLGLGRENRAEDGSFLAVVRWCTPEPDGGFRVELAAHRQVTQADLLDLGSDAACMIPDFRPG